ncbi:MAG: Holliday junction resolvase RuvX [Planctomycetota bacterium]|jgi:putative Holliday junction resolvase
MRYLAIDYGTKRTGLAICDPAETIASPLGVIEGQKDLIARIAAIAGKEKVGAIVVGLPLNMDDSAGPQAKLVFQFAAQLEKQLDIPVHFQDERLSSFGAKEKLAPVELARKKKRKHVDAVAAAEILEAFIEQKKTG